MAVRSIVRLKIWVIFLSGHHSLELGHCAHSLFHQLSSATDRLTDTSQSVSAP